MARLVGINHVAVEVGDVDEAVAFLERIFDDVSLRGRSTRMAFVDLGDQFIALEAGRAQAPDRGRHVGLVVDDQAEVVRRARDAGAQMVGSHDFLDPWGNRWQVVDYREVQFTKAPRVLEGMGLEGVEKSGRALDELRAKGLAD
jgi:predicted enzyme related to lactoylglutathione lyase